MNFLKRADTFDVLVESWNIQEEASSRGFDWPDISGVFDKVEEELREIREAWALCDREEAGKELGDLLFAMVNLARFVGRDPRSALHETNVRFTRRFDLLKEEVARRGMVMEECTLEELDRVWEHVKDVLSRESEKGS